VMPQYSAHVRSVQSNGRAAVCCLLLMLLSAGGTNNFHRTVVVAGQQVGIITPSDEVVDELPKRFARNTTKASVAVMELIKSVLLWHVPSVLLGHSSIASLGGGLLRQNHA
jgi:hypothetical protein